MAKYDILRKLKYLANEAKTIRANINYLLAQLAYMEKNGSNKIITHVDMFKFKLHKKNTLIKTQLKSNSINYLCANKAYQKLIAKEHTIKTQLHMYMCNVPQYNFDIFSKEFISTKNLNDMYCTINNVYNACNWICEFTISDYCRQLYDTNFIDENVCTSVTKISDVDVKYLQQIKIFFNTVSKNNAGDIFFVSLCDIQSLYMDGWCNWICDHLEWMDDTKLLSHLQKL